jgi:hypothetical protein
MFKTKFNRLSGAGLGIWIRIRIRIQAGQKSSQKKEENE